MYGWMGVELLVGLQGVGLRTPSRGLKQHICEHPGQSLALQPGLSRQVPPCPFLRHLNREGYPDLGTPRVPLAHLSPPPATNAYYY